MNTRSRSLFLDFVKGFAIFCVIFGHCIQYGSGTHILTDRLFFDDILFKIIYSFHMPLFMIVSGYLFSFSVERQTYSALLKKRIYSLLIPVFVWSLIPLTAKVMNLVLSGQSIRLMYVFKTYLLISINNLWFLWAVFWCSSAVILVRQCFNDSKCVYLVGFLLTFLIPDVFGLALYKFMYPYFLAGYLCGRENIISKLKTICQNNLTLLLCFAAFAILLRFYHRDTYIYTTGYYLFRGEPGRQFAIDIYRCCIGFIGSALVLSILFKLFPFLNSSVKKGIGHIGANTFGIYIISNCLFSYVLPHLTASLQRINYVFTTIESILVLSASFLITICLKKNRMLNKLLLGERK